MDKNQIKIKLLQERLEKELGSKILLEAKGKIKKLSELQIGESFTLVEDLIGTTSVSSAFPIKITPSKYEGIEFTVLKKNANTIVTRCKRGQVIFRYKTAGQSYRSESKDGNVKVTGVKDLNDINTDQFSKIDKKLLKASYDYLLSVLSTGSQEAIKNFAKGASGWNRGWMICWLAYKFGYQPAKKVGGNGFDFPILKSSLRSYTNTDLFALIENGDLVQEGKHLVPKNKSENFSYDSDTKDQFKQDLKKPNNSTKTDELGTIKQKLKQLHPLLKRYKELTGKDYK